MKPEQTKIVTPFRTSVRRPITWDFVRREVPKVIKREVQEELPLAA